MKELKKRARQLLTEFKGDSYVYGVDCLERIGGLVSPFGENCLLITNLGERSKDDLGRITTCLSHEKLEVIGPVPSARPNAPREDVSRLAEEISKVNPSSVVVVAGGSGIDAAKAAVVLAVLGGDVENYFGTGKVTERLLAAGKELIPVIAVQTASGSAAHLTKYSNITDIKAAQKKLIVDEAIVPPKALFDYRLTTTMPTGLTLDGAFDGIAHCLEVFYGARPETFSKIRKIAEVGMELIIASVEKAVSDGEDIEAREALGLGTDLGGYAIMIGGTSGAHLNSFSLVDILSHGRACAIMNPYYTVFFGSAIQQQLQILSRIYARYDLVEQKVAELKGKELAIAMAEGMVRLAKRVGFPTKLSEIEGFSNAHVERALQAAKNPQLEMKLKNMPVPLETGMVDEYMGSILEAAITGGFSLIKNVQR
ncbi:3-dehydroquinate synthase [bacterium (candidate division B38) B3_B38]|nr:MAG: 3-dehydroquinate synthase [bacterium (candidate division B38) B3_B38]